MAIDRLHDRREFLRLLAAFSGAAALAACGGAGGGPGAPTATAPRGQASPTPSVPRVSASTKAAVSHLKSLISTTPWAVANEKGFFGEAGITQEVTEFSGGGDTVRGLLQAGNNYGLTTPSATVAAFMQGQPIRIIGGGFGSTSVVFVAKKDSAIQAIKDLAGKKVGYSSPRSASQFLAMRTLKDNGITAQLVATGGVGESLTALRNGVVDAAWTPYPQPQKFANELTIVFSGAKTLPDFVEFMLTTTEDYAQRNGEVLRAFLHAYDKTLQFIQQSPDEAATIWAKAAKFEPAQAAVDGIREIPKEAWSIKIKSEALKLIEESMLEFKEIDKPVDWQKLVVQDFLAPDRRTTL
jgi:NitT/TauT family transport system substrate-binding protein